GPRRRRASRPLGQLSRPELRKDHADRGRPDRSGRTCTEWCRRLDGASGVDRSRGQIRGPLGVTFMTTTAANHQGRVSGPVIRRVLRCAFVLVAGIAGIGSAHAENVLEKISYNSLPGGKVELTLKLSGPVGEPQIFTTDTPPRI